MKGADEYATLFPRARQYGRLYLLPGSHARGSTFCIYVLPAGESVIEGGGINPPLNEDAVKVFGITGGEHGWSETYGWLHHGRWQDDFAALCEQETLRRLAEHRKDKGAREKAQESDETRKQKLLASY